MNIFDEERYLFSKFFCVLYILIINSFQSLLKIFIIYIIYILFKCILYLI